MDKEPSGYTLHGMPKNKCSRTHFEKSFEDVSGDALESGQEGVKKEPHVGENVKEKIEEVRKELQGMDSREIIVERDITGDQTREERIKAYQTRYLPPYLRGSKGLIGTIITELYASSVKFEVEGREYIPQHGPFLIICNHFGGGEVEALLKTFKEHNVHFGLAKNIWWNTSSILQWVFKRMQMIPIEESLRNISEEQKEEALLKQGLQGKKMFRKIIDREKDGEAPINVTFFHQAIAVLSKGDALCMFPEGLWFNPVGVGKMSHEKEELKQGYRGIELIARQYKKLTGEELPIIPLAFIVDRQRNTRRLYIQKPLLLEENQTGLNATDWCMAHIANMLPESQRGYYTNIVHKI